MDTLTYKDFGVDIDEGNSFVQDLKPLVKQTFNNHVLGGLGGFSGCFEIPQGYKNPVLCSATDGVGSKLSLAISYNKLHGIGIDLVAMCVNDLICDFAKPLFFLDYYATHKLIKAQALEVLKGIIEGCKIADCALIGGETAEMPSIYAKGDFDLAGFAIGIAEKEEINKRESIQDGDVVLGISSSGFHSNGFSLIRGIIETHRIDMFQKIHDKTLIDWILEPTYIYVPYFLQHKDKIKALAHITGGGIVENLIRVLPHNKQAIISEDLIQIPQIFHVFLPHVAKQEAFRVFNMGIGMTLVVAKEDVDSFLNISHVNGMQTYVIGHIQSGEKQVLLK